MKTNIFKYVAVAAIVLVGLGFVACEKREATQVTFSNDEAFGQLKFMSMNERIATDKAMLRTTKYLKTNSGIVVEEPDVDIPEEGFSIVIARWNGWGLKKYGCRSGAGLCEIVFFPDWRYEDSQGDEFDYSSIVEHDVNRDLYYTDIMLAEPAPKNIPDESFNLTVDEEIFIIDAKSSVGSDLVVKEGVYSLDRNLGIAGGYRIPFEKTIN